MKLDELLSQLGQLYLEKGSVEVGIDGYDIDSIAMHPDAEFINIKSKTYTYVAYQAPEQYTPFAMQHRKSPRNYK